MAGDKDPMALIYEEFYCGAGKGEGSHPDSPEKYSPYEFFSAEKWSEFKTDIVLNLANEEIIRLRSVGDPIDLEEVRRIYLALSSFLSIHVEASKNLFEKRSFFLNKSDSLQMPYIIAIAGSVAVGKSTAARLLKELLGGWPGKPKVDCVTTDGFLYPNHVLNKFNMMERKGFPESYDIGALIRFLSGVKSGMRNILAPVYSHSDYDVKLDEFVCIENPDILILEGVNVLQPGKIQVGQDMIPFISDFFDFSIYIDADENLIHDWYMDRFMQFRETAFKDPHSFFHRYSRLSEEEARIFAKKIWETNNLKNLRENIRPTRSRADLILRKGKNHLVKEVGIRKM